MSAPIKNTCPDINHVIKQINLAINEGKSLLRNKTDDIKDSYETIEYMVDYLFGLDDILEKLRESNSILREYGESLEQKINFIDNEF